MDDCSRVRFGDLKARDLHRQDARKALVPASNYSVIGGIRKKPVSEIIDTFLENDGPLRYRCDSEETATILRVDLPETPPLVLRLPRPAR